MEISIRGFKRFVNTDESKSLFDLPIFRIGDSAVHVSLWIHDEWLGHRSLPWGTLWVWNGSFSLQSQTAISFHTTFHSLTAWQCGPHTGEVNLLTWTFDNLWWSLHFGIKDPANRIFLRAAHQTAQQPTTTKTDQKVISNREVSLDWSQYFWQPSLLCKLLHLWDVGVWLCLLTVYVARFSLSNFGEME